VSPRRGRLAGLMCLLVCRERNKGYKEERGLEYVPMAFPEAQQMKFMATTTDFFV